MGTPSFAAPSLEALLASRHEVAAVVTRPDRPSGRGLAVRPSPVKERAERAGLPVLQPETIRTGAFLDAVREIAPGALVVVAYGKILPPALLASAPHGGVNVHASLLPKYRGAAPVAWAIARGETVTGVTTMRMVEKLDAGEIYLQRSTAIGPEETAGEVESRLALMGAALLVETLDALEEGSMAFLPQREEEATFAPLLAKEDGRIDWSLTAREIALRVRAFDPWPVAFTTARGKTLRVRRAREGEPGEPGAREAREVGAAREAGAGPVARAAREARPGEVLAAGPSGVAVACGGGTVLCLLEVQPEGGRRMGAAEAAAGRHLAAGDLLGA